MTPTLVSAKLKFTLAVLLLGGCLAAGTFAVGRHYLTKAPVEAKAEVTPPPFRSLGESARGTSGAASAPAARDGQPVAATIETTLATASGQIRQFAFDGDGNTFFASAQNAGRADHFTLVFDEPVAVKSVAATTGRPGGGDRLDVGVLAAIPGES
jgi:hypothetical protein